jgi:hypothetical protein
MCGCVGVVTSKFPFQPLNCDTAIFIANKCPVKQIFERTKKIQIQIDEIYLLNKTKEN